MVTPLVICITTRSYGMSPHAEIERLTLLIAQLKGRPNTTNTVAVLERRIAALRAKA